LPDKILNAAASFHDLEMKGQLFLAVCSPAFGTSSDERSEAFPDNQV